MTIQLVTKDRPILAAALAARADYLLTGDKRHFSHLYGLKLQGTIVSSPAAFLAQHMDRIPSGPLT